MKKDMIKSIGIASAFLFLTGCGNNYPEVGKFSGGKFGAKQVTEYSTVYSLEPGEFESWKEKLAELKDLSTFSESDLLKLQQDFSASPLIRKAFASKPLLVAEQLDLDSITTAEYGLTAKQIEDINSSLLNVKQQIEVLKDKKAKAEAAKIELERIKNEIKAEKDGLLTQFNTLKARSADIFKQYTKKDIGTAYPPKEIVLKGHPFDYVIYKKSDLPCREFAIGKNKWQKDRYQTYIYADKITVGEKSYCPIFKTMGSSKTTRKAIVAALTDTDKSLLRQAATANVKYKKEKKGLNTKERNVTRDNDAIYQLSKSFRYKDKRQLARLTENVNRANEKINQLSKVTKESIKAEKIKQLTALLERAKSYYLFENLHHGLKKESVIQPDGTFTLKSGEDFYLVEIDPTEMTQPNVAQYALIRMEQHRNQDMVAIEPDAFFAFSNLPQITL